MNSPDPGPARRPGRRDASQLSDILDALAGITPEMRDDCRDEDLDAAAPLPPDFVDRALVQLRRSPRAPAPRSRWSWCRRPAAILPIAIGALLLAAGPVYYFVWSRKHLEDLSYEGAILEVLDQTSPIRSRHAALGRIATQIMIALKGIRGVAADPDASEKLQTTARAALETLRGMTDLPDRLEAPLESDHGRFQQLLTSLNDTSQPEARRTAIEELVEACRGGFYVLREARHRHPMLAEMTRIQLKHIKQRLGN
jgi:hypothetical protein